jgi:hypothetical protein
MDWLVREVRDAKDEVSHGDSGQKKQGREKAQLLCQSVKSEAMDNFCTRAEFSIAPREASASQESPRLSRGFGVVSQILPVARHANCSLFFEVLLVQSPRNPGSDAGRHGGRGRRSTAPS